MNLHGHTRDLAAAAGRPRVVPGGTAWATASSKIVGVAAHFDATVEVTLNKLRYPLDEESDAFFRSPPTT